MKTKNYISFCSFILMILILSCNREEAFNPSSFVDTNIGSVHGRWFFYTPAAHPFGMAKLAPHTNAYNSQGGWMPCGYDDRHRSIEGFGNFHEFQIGGLVIMPTCGELKTLPGSLENPDEGYRSRFRKETESAGPGFYEVFLDDYQIAVRLTATERVGFHEYAFPKTEKAQILFDIGHKQGESSDVIDCHIAYRNGAVSGWIETYPEYAKFCHPGQHVKMYFYALLSKVPEKVSCFVDEKVLESQDSVGGPGCGIILHYKTGEKEKLLIKTGLSYTSVENARNNLYSEAEELSFDDAQSLALEAWKEKLSRIRVEGGQKEDIVKFYTGLYHALLGRGLSSDVNGSYPGFEGVIGQIPLDINGKPLYHHYNTDGIWAACWNLTQLWSLVYPEYFKEYIQSNIDFYKESGWLHDGQAAGVYTNGVQTNFNGLVIASAYNWGIRDFDLKMAYEAALKNELGYLNRDFGSGKYDVYDFVSKGFIPFKDTTISNGWVFNFGASHALEYCFSAYGVANMAKAMGEKKDYQKLMNLAASYKKMLDPETKYIRPLYEDGDFVEDFNPMEAWRGFQEGNAFQYTWYIPHDPIGLRDFLGKDLMNERLEKMFEDARKSIFGGGKEIHSFSGLEKLYNHGNQPCLHQSFLFNYSGKPWLTQKWSRLICDEFYGTEALHGYGFGQDEDQGQLGAWYVMASMGLFDVQGGTAERPSVQFGSPQFDRIRIKLNRDYYPQDEIDIEVKNNAPNNYYIQSLSLGEQALNKCWVFRDELIKEGKLVITMGPEPNREWGIGEDPPSMTNCN